MYTKDANKSTSLKFVDVEGIGIGGDVNIEVIELGFGDS